MTETAAKPKAHTLSKKSNARYAVCTVCGNWATRVGSRSAFKRLDVLHPCTPTDTAEAEA